jgi:hypothetical protein
MSLRQARTSRVFGESRVLRESTTLSSERGLELGFPVGPLPCGPRSAVRRGLESLFRAVESCCRTTNARDGRTARIEPPEDMDRSSRQLRDIAAWLVRNEGRTWRLTASSRDGSHWLHRRRHCFDRSVRHRLRYFGCCRSYFNLSRRIDVDQPCSAAVRIAPIQS